MPTKPSGKILEFVTTPASIEGELEKWFRGVMLSHRDLMFTLEQMNDSFRKVLAEKAIAEANYPVLAAAEITIRNAKNARAL